MTTIRGSSVPFDGRTQFQLGNYWETPYEGTVAEGAAVMLLFTIKKGALPPGVAAHKQLALKSALYLDILGIFVLAEPTEPFSLIPSQETAQDVGVRSIKVFDDENENGGGEDPLM